MERETQRTGKKLTQREFVLGLIEEALAAAQQQSHREVGVGPCEAGSEDGSPQPQEEGDPAALSA